jgi:hypothetical protein
MTDLTSIRVLLHPLQSLLDSLEHLILVLLLNLILELVLNIGLHVVAEGLQLVAGINLVLDLLIL